MNNLNNLNQKLVKLQAQKNSFTSLSDISLPQFLHYKKILAKEKKISKKIENKISLGNEINFWYDSQTKSWIENPNINPRKYYKMEKNAAYKKELKLYKLGISNKKPIHPLIQNLKSCISPITNFFKEQFENIKPTLAKYNFFSKIIQKYNHFKSETLPKNINKFAVSTATIGIKGYRTIKSDCRYIRRSLASKNSFKYIKNVIKEANKKVNNSEHISFRESIKIDNFKSCENSFTNFNSEIVNVNPTYLINRKKSNSHCENKYELVR